LLLLIAITITTLYITILSILYIISSIMSSSSMQTNNMAPPAVDSDAHRPQTNPGDGSFTPANGGEHTPEYLRLCWNSGIAPGVLTTQEIYYTWNMANERVDPLLGSPRGLHMVDRLIVVLGLTPVAVLIFNRNLSISQKWEYILGAARRVLTNNRLGPWHENPGSLEGKDWDAWRFNTLFLADLEWLIGSTDAAAEHYDNVWGIWQDRRNRGVSQGIDDFDRLCSNSIFFHLIEKHGRYQVDSLGRIALGGRIPAVLDDLDRAPARAAARQAAIDASNARISAGIGAAPAA
jgi:hypothetical protein